MGFYVLDFEYLLLIGSEMSKFRILCLAAAFAISAHAASPIKKVASGGVSGWGVGFGEHTNPSLGAITLDYKGPSHEFGMGLSTKFFNDEDGSDDFNVFFYGFNIGARQMVKPDFAISGGFNWSSALVEKWSAIRVDALDLKLETIPYRIGFYSGFSYEPTSYLSLFVRNDIISYASPGVDTRNSEVSLFGATQMGITYYYQ